MILPPQLLSFTEAVDVVANLATIVAVGGSLLYTAWRVLLRPLNRFLESQPISAIFKWWMYAGSVLLLLFLFLSVINLRHGVRIVMKSIDSKRPLWESMLETDRAIAERLQRCPCISTTSHGGPN